MTNPRYAFLKLDAPISNPIRLGKPDLTAQDVVLACAGLPRSRFLYSVVVWVGDNKDLPELIRLALVEAVGLDEVRKQHSLLSNKKNQLRDIIIQAIEEKATSNICKVCNGRKEIVIDHRVISCEPCNGTGLTLRKNQPKRMRALYDSVYHMFSDWEYEIFNRISHKLNV